MRTSLVPCLVTVCASCALAATPQYQGPVQISTGFQKLSGLAIADFNGDGIPDIAVTDGLDKRVVVYLGHGDGTFAAPVSTTLTIDDMTGALLAGDFNEDGRADLIVATISGDQADILLVGKGDGTFTQGAALQGSFGFIGGVAVDLNGDSHLDVVGAQNGSLYVHTGDGHGNFVMQPLSQPSSSAIFFDVTAGDFTSDGKIDFLAGGFLPTSTLPLNFYAGLGNGTFAAPTTVALPNIFDAQFLDSADFDGDGKRDVIVGSPNIASVLLGNGDGTFRFGSGLYTPEPQGVEPAQASPQVAAADMDGDGKPDAVVVDNVANTVNVFINDGSGGFRSQGPDFSAATDAGSGHVKTADFNGDGLPDIVVTNYLTGKISVFLSVPPAKVAPTVSIITGTTQGLVGGSVAVSVAVIGAQGPGSGTVQLLEGATTLMQQTLDASGKATLATSTLAVGQHMLTVTYAGDKQYLASATASFAASVTDFGVALRTSSQTVVQGGTATYSLALTPVAAFMGSVTLTCSGLPTGATCSAQPTMVSGQPATVALLVSTPATRSALETGRSRGRMYAVPLLCLMLFGGMLPFRRARISSLLVLLLSAGGGFLAGCGGSSSGSQGSTPPQSTSFTIIASATQGSQTVSHQVSATLVVQ